MRILMISNHLGVQSGVQRYVQNLLLNLDTDRYQIDLFVGQCPPDQTSTAPALEAHGVHIIAVPDNKKDRIRALAAHLRTHRDYDIIHYHTASNIIIFFINIHKSILNCKIIACIRNLNSIIV